MSRVAVVGGGRSVEHDVSLASAAGVAEGLAEAGHSVLRLTVDRAGGWHAGPAPELTPLTLPAAVGVLRRCDVVFPAMHGPHGEDGELAALCEVALVPYVGCGVGAGALAMDKWATKLLAEAAGVPTVPGRPLSAGERGSFAGPCVVKPVRSGSSHGVHLVTDPTAYDAAVDAAYRCDTRVLVEQVAAGREIDLGIVEHPDGRLQVLPALEIGRVGVFDTTTKYDGSADFRVPAALRDDELAALTEAALTVFDALDCRGLARVDFFLDATGPVLNEVNTMPGLTPHSQLPRMAAAAGLPYPALLDLLVQTALARVDGVTSPAAVPVMAR